MGYNEFLKSELLSAFEDGSLEIDGLNIDEGIKNSGSKELFFNLLGDFYKLVDMKSSKIEHCIKENDIRGYTVEVHGLKNTTRMLGALELSEKFYQLELLGKSNEWEDICRNTPEVLEQFRNYKSVLEEYVDTSDNGVKLVSLSVIERTLRRLYEAADGFDIDAVDSSMHELETFIIPLELGPLIEQLSIFVSDVAWEEVLRISKEAIRVIQEKKEEYSTIMIVDDDLLNIKAVTSMLQEEFYVLSASSGKELFDELEDYIPSLILLDIHMPEMNGHHIIQRLKQDHRYMDIPVIFLTSDDDENTEIQSLSEGAIDFIRKPFRKNVAIQRIHRIIELSYLQNNLRDEVVKQTAVAEERRKSMERLANQMISSLANTIDAKDAYTNGHSSRVAKYSVMIAERMGYSGERLEGLYYSALLHDIGKIGIPGSIINKTSKLSDEEYELIKSHPEIGWNILSQITEIPNIAIGAKWHHERYDGRGYPDGLVGESIPEIARIIGVADTYDAMTSKRSYRDVLPQDVVINELEKGKGNQFDPEIAQIMIRIIEEDVQYELHE